MFFNLLFEPFSLFFSFFCNTAIRLSSSVTVKDLTVSSYLPFENVQNLTAPISIPTVSVKILGSYGFMIKYRRKVFFQRF